MSDWSSSATGRSDEILNRKSASSASATGSGLPETRTVCCPGCSRWMCSRSPPTPTTACGGIGEIARDGATAILVRTEDAADLRRGLEKALGDAELRKRLGTAARLYCVANLSVETMLDRMEKVFRDVARR